MKLWAVLAGIISFGLFIAIGLILFINSSLLANQPPVMKLRQYYFLRHRIGWGDVSDTNTGLPFKIIASQAITINEKTFYVYALIGKLEEINQAEEVIYLKTKDGKKTGFKYSNSSDELGRLAMSDYLEGKDQWQWVDLESNPLTPGDWFLIYWDDSRFYDELIAAADSDGGIVNLYDDGDPFEVIYWVKHAD